MSRLDSGQIDDHFANHLPYRTRILLAHYKMTHDTAGKDVSWTEQSGPLSHLEACFEASLITGRLYLNLLGIRANRDGSALKGITRREPDDLAVEDLGGLSLDIATLTPSEQSLFLAFIVMANKAAAHLTTGNRHDVAKAHPAILRIHNYLKTNLYDPARRTGLETLASRFLGTGE